MHDSPTPQPAEAGHPSQPVPPPSHTAPAAPASGPAALAVTGPWARPVRVVTLGMVLLIVLNAFEAMAVTTAMPAVVDELGGLSLYGTAFAAPVAASVVGMVLAGLWSDRRSPAQPALVGTLLFVAGLVVVGTAGSMLTVVGGRLVQGLGGGMIGVALYVVVAQLYPDAVQPRVFSLFATAWVLPSVVGPALAGWVTETVGWRWVFLGVPLAALPALLTLRAVASRLHDRQGPPPGRDAARRLLLAVGTGAGVLLLHWGGQQDGARALLPLVGGALLVGLCAPLLLPRGTVRAARGLPAVVLVRGLLAAAFFGAEVFLPLLLQTERGLRPGVAGLALTTAALLWSTGSWIRGRTEGRWRDQHILAGGGLLIVLGVASGASAVAPGVPVALSMAGWGLGGLGMGLIYPTLSLLTLRLSKPGDQGRNSSALQVSEALLVTLVLAVTGPVFAALLTRDVVAAYAAAFGIAGALALVGTWASSRTDAGPVRTG